MQKILCRCCSQYKDVSEFENIQHFSVDFDFCIKAKEAGFKIFIDPDAEMKHIGDAPLIGKYDFLRCIKEEHDTKNKG